MQAFNRRPAALRLLDQVKGQNNITHRWWVRQVLNSEEKYQALYEKMEGLVSTQENQASTEDYWMEALYQNST